ncbi:MAG: hypothetical protein U0559_10615 [Anaerolineae bacterium]
MLRKHWVLGLLAGQVIVFLLLISLFVTQPSASASPSTATVNSPAAAPGRDARRAGRRARSIHSGYAAKFVCGWQQPAPAGTNPQGEFIVKPGNYATDINIHNPNYKQKCPFARSSSSPCRMARLLQTNAQVERRIVTMTLGADMVTMDDCNNLWKYSFPAGPPPGQMPLTISLSRRSQPSRSGCRCRLHGDAPGDMATTGVSIDVERVAGKRVYLPASCQTGRRAMSRSIPLATALLLATASLIMLIGLVAAGVAARASASPPARLALAPPIASAEPYCFGWDFLNMQVKMHKGSC